MLRASKQRSADLGMGSTFGINLGLVQRAEDHPRYVYVMRKGFGASTFDCLKLRVLLRSNYLPAKLLSSVFNLESPRASEANNSTWFLRRL